MVCHCTSGTLTKYYTHMLFLHPNMIALEKENEGDPDMAEMIASELEALSNQLTEFEGKLKVNKYDTLLNSCINSRQYV